MNMVAILMMSANLATLGFLKFLWNKGYNIIVSFHDIINTITLLRESNYLVNVVMWTKFGSSSIYMKEVIVNGYCNLNFITIWPEKRIFWEVLLVQV